MSENNAVAKNFFSGKVVTVTGGVGSVGKAIVERLLKLNVERINVIDINESELFEQQQVYSGEDRFVPIQLNICNDWEMERLVSGSDYIFHAAALKHVPSCEVSPFSAIETNILGTKSIINAALKNNVTKVVFTSSDKAVNPTNVMGASKLLGERLFIAANEISTKTGKKTLFANTRFGNVAGSRGSVIPLFLNQINRKKNLTLTDKSMTRFMMSLSEASELVIETMCMAMGGETFITKMPSINIYDLAKTLLRIHGQSNDEESSIEIIGVRQGEKKWEELSSDEESRRILENDKFLCVLPYEPKNWAVVEENYTQYGFKKSSKIYNSHNEEKLNDLEIEEFIRNCQINGGL